MVTLLGIAILLLALLGLATVIAAVLVAVGWHLVTRRRTTGARHARA